MDTDMPDPALAAVAVVRSMVDHLAPVEDPLAAKGRAALCRYLDEAATGLTLDQALGLHRASGAGPWWVQEARDLRDQAIREVCARFYGNHALSAAADEIARLAARRLTARTPPANDKEALIDAALKTGVKFPKKQRLRAVLSISPP